MISFFDRRELLSTYSAQEVGQVRAALTGLGIEFKIKTINRTGRVDVGPGRPLPFDAPPRVAFEYVILVHKDDLELAQAALRGSLD